MVFDAHSDLLYDVTRRRLLGERRVLEHHHLDRLRRGGVEGLVLAVWASGPRETFWKDTAWKDPASNLGRTHQIFACARADLAECPQIRPVHTAAEAEAARAAGQIYAFLAVEGMAAIGGNPAGVDWYYGQGARLGMLTWNETNALAAGARGDPQAGLTEAGRRAVRRMGELGMVVDVSHLNDGGFWDVMDLAAGPVIASHSNCRALSPHNRNLTDEMIRALAEKGGIAGLNYCASFVDADSAHPKLCRSTVERLAKHAAHFKQVGGIEVISLGSDFDGIGGQHELETAADMPLLAEALRREGFTEDEVEAIYWRNAYRFFKNNL
mgnify:CR=1 FL=1